MKALVVAGRGEQFESVEELVQCLRPGVLIDAASLPCLSNTDRHGLAAPLNSYILDWWRHGQIKLLETANGLQEGEKLPCCCQLYAKCPHALSTRLPCIDFLLQA